MMGINMHLEPLKAEPPMGSSYFWDAPQLPDSNLYPFTTDENQQPYPMQFICQLNCEHLPKNSMLPSQGMLYFFGEVDYFLGYDVKDPNGLGVWADNTIRAFYCDVAPEQLQRVNFFNEDDMIAPHVITFENGIVRDMGFRLLGKPYEEEVDGYFDEKWVQLLQLDSEENGHFDLRFYDMGLLYIMIERERLLHRDFSHLRAFMTSL